MKLRDLEWVFVLFGTAIGAGILFLPIQAAISGVIPLIIASVVVVPIIYYAEGNLAKILLDEEKDYNILQIFDLRFNKILATLSSLIYFLTCFTVIIAYAVSLPHEVGNALKIYGLTSVNFADKAWFSFFVLGAPILVMMTSMKLMLKVMSIIIYPLIISLLIISCSLIPYWDISNIDFSGFKIHSFLHGFLMVFPILIFSMNFSQSISQMSIYYKLNKGSIGNIDKKVMKNILLGTLLISFFTLFFIYSCVLSVNDEVIASAAKENISAIAVLSSHFKIGFLHYLGPVIAVCAILSSFLGVFIGTLESFDEGFTQLIKLVIPGDHKLITSHRINLVSSLVIFVILWGIAVFNLKIIFILGIFTAPCIAALIFILPAVYKIYITGKFDFRKNIKLYIMVIVGMLTIFGYALGLLVVT